MAVNKKRPLLNLATPLRDIPREWLQYIEPHIKREGTCWYWQGSHFPDGYAQMLVVNPKTGKKNGRRVVRIVAEMFYENLKDHRISLSCGRRSCLNPAHVVVQKLCMRK